MEEGVEDADVIENKLEEDISWPGLQAHEFRTVVPPHGIHDLFKVARHLGSSFRLYSRKKNTYIHISNTIEFLDLESVRESS